jgi:hypothetical protein
MLAVARMHMDAVEELQLPLAVSRNDSQAVQADNGLVPALARNDSQAVQEDNGLVLALALALALPRNDSQVVQEGAPKLETSAQQLFHLYAHFFRSLP